MYICIYKYICVYMYIYNTCILICIYLDYCITNILHHEFAKPAKSLPDTAQDLQPRSDVARVAASPGSQ